MKFELAIAALFIFAVSVGAVVFFVDPTTEHRTIECRLAGITVVKGITAGEQTGPIIEYVDTEKRVLTAYPRVPGLDCALGLPMKQSEFEEFVKEYNEE